MALLTALGVLLLVVANVAISVVLVRFFRIRLDTAWAVAIYVAVLGPIALAVTTVVLSGVFRLGGAIGGMEPVIVLAILLPLALGVTVDVFWMPAPEEVELPDTDERRE